MKYDQRIFCLNKLMALKHLDAILMTSPYNRRYLTGFTADDSGIDESSGAVLVTKDEIFLLTDGRYKTQAETEAGFCTIKIYKKALADELKKIVAKTSLKKIAFEPAYITCSMMKQIQKSLSGVVFKELSGELEQMRSIKDDAEAEAISRSQAAAEQVFEAMLECLRPGMTEKAVAWRILEGAFSLADGPSFPPIVASGPNSALPHATPTDRVLQDGEPIVIDMGVRLGGYCSDMTRTVFLGEPSPQMKEIYAIVRHAQCDAQKGIRAGMSGKEADHIARKVIEDAGYGRYFLHSLGHGVGLAIHEHPRLSPKADKIMLKQGMVVTVEPGIYIAGVGGVRLENMALVQDGGIKLITSEKWFYNF